MGRPAVTGDSIEERIARDAEAFREETAGFDVEAFVAETSRRLRQPPDDGQRERNLVDFAAIVRRHDADPDEQRRIAALTAEFDAEDSERKGIEP